MPKHSVRIFLHVNIGCIFLYMKTSTFYLSITYAIYLDVNNVFKFLYVNNDHVDDFLILCK